jgi:hypothetical protein
MVVPAATSTEFAATREVGYHLPKNKLEMGKVKADTPLRTLWAGIPYYDPEEA